MARKVYTDKPAFLTLKVEQALLKQIGDEVLFQTAQQRRPITRTDVVKELLKEALAARLKKRSK